MSTKATPFEPLYGRKFFSLLCRADFGDTQLGKKHVGNTLLIRPKIINETIKKIVRIKEQLRMTRDRQKKYTDFWRKPLEFQVRDRFMLRVSPCKRVIRFGKSGKLNPLYIGCFEILAKIGLVVYRLALPQELNDVHNVFCVSNFNKCFFEDMLVVPLDKIQINTKLNFVKKPVEIMEHAIKRLKKSCIPIVKVRCNSKWGPEYTWEHDDQMTNKYPHLFENAQLHSTF